MVSHPKDLVNKLTINYVSLKTNGFLQKTLDDIRLNLTGTITETLNKKNGNFLLKDPFIFYYSEYVCI